MGKKHIKTSSDYENEYFELKEETPVFKYADEKTVEKYEKKKEKQLRFLAKKAEKARKAEKTEKLNRAKKEEKIIENQKKNELKKKKKELEKAEKKQQIKNQSQKSEYIKTIQNKQKKAPTPITPKNQAENLHLKEVKKTAFTHIDNDDYFPDDEFSDLYDEENEQISMRPKHLLRYIILVIILAGIGFFIANFDTFAPAGIISYIEDIFSSNSSEKTTEIDVTDISVLSAQKTSKDIVLLTDTSILNYSKNGGLQFDRQHGYVAPRMSTSGTYLLTYDSYGKKFRVDSRSKNIIDTSITKNIVAADISENKKIAIVTETEGYAAELNIYNFSLEKENFKWYSAENNVIDVSLSPNGNQAAVITIGASGGQFVSYLTILNFSKDKPVAKIEYLNTALVSVDFKTNSEVTVIGDNICSVVPVKNLKRKTDYRFDESPLVTYDCGERGTLLALVKYSDITKNELVFISQKGSVYFEKTIDESILSVSLSGRRCYVLTKTKLLEFDIKGRLIREKEQTNDGYLLSSISNSSFVIGNSSIVLK